MCNDHQRTAKFLTLGACGALMLVGIAHSAAARSVHLGNGAAANRSVSGKYATGRSVNENYTTAGGHTYNRTVTTTAKDGDFTRTATGPNGNVRTSEGTYDKANHTYTDTTTVGGHDVTLDGTKTRGSNTGTYTTAGGKTGSFDVTNARSGNSVSRDATVTTASGKTYNRDTTYTYHPKTGTVTRSR